MYNSPGFFHSTAETVTYAGWEQQYFVGNCVTGRGEITLDAGGIVLYNVYNRYNERW